MNDKIFYEKGLHFECKRLSWNEYMEDCGLLNKFKTLPFLGEELGNKNGYDFTGYRKMYACKKANQNCIFCY